MTPEFKKCPFCGNEVYILSEEEKQEYADMLPDFNASRFHFCCSGSEGECVIGIADNFVEINWSNEEEAAVSWNRRVGEGAQ